MQKARRSMAHWPCRSVVLLRTAATRLDMFGLCQTLFTRRGFSALSPNFLSRCAMQKRLSAAPRSHQQVILAVFHLQKSGTGRAQTLCLEMRYRYFFMDLHEQES